MTTHPKCPTCGAALTPDAPEGLCPACLVKQAMATAVPSPTVAVEPAQTQTINPEVGAKVRYFGEYELLEEIARGGMGMIYKARQASLNRTVALKMILSGQLASDVEVKRFHVEAEAAANLQHPNIVAIHEVGEHDGRHYFTMDYVEGKNLAQILGGKPMPAQRAAGYVKTIAEAIHFAHQRGTLHRDLKPQNIMIDTLDHVRITDFGLARQVQGDSSLTRTGAIMGSPSYMPPEQAKGRQDLVGPHSDVYAIGAILYELLTGRPPFMSTTPMATLMQAATQDPVPPRSLNSVIPVDLETVCLKCLEKSPEQRYASARALAEELDRFLKNEPVLARPASALRKAVSWSRRHRTLMTALVSAVILGLAGLAYGLWQQTQYLTWLNLHPDTTKVTGPRTTALRGLKDWAVNGFVALGFLFAYYRKLSRDLEWRDLFDPSHMQVPPRPIAPAAAVAFFAAGWVGIGWALWLAAKSVEAFVWEGSFWWPVWLSGVYMLFCFGFALVLIVVREQAAATFGLSPTTGPAQLPPDQFDAICRALYAGRKMAAVELYREFASVSPREARVQIELFAGRQYDEQPWRFTADPTRPPPLCRKRFLLLGLGGGLVLALALPFFPPRLCPSWPVALGAGVLSGGWFAGIGLAGCGSWLSCPS